MRRGLLLLMLGMISACATETATPEPAGTAWGAAIQIGRAEQINAPALAVNDKTLAAAWIAADDTGIHQDMFTLQTGNQIRTVVLPLPPINPYDQQIASAADNGYHLFWLDQTLENTTRLHAALVSESLEVIRGPVVISDESARRYTLLPNSDGSVWVIFSGSELYYPRLYTRYLDARGRPRLEPATNIATDADWPTVAVTNAGQHYLFWIGHTDGKIYRALFQDGVVENPTALLDTVPLNTGDRLTAFQAALDRTHQYLFWDISRMDGSAETWFSTSPLDKQEWQQPRRVGVNGTYTTFFSNLGQDAPSLETGFNSGLTYAASEGDTWAGWIMPLRGQFDVLPVAAQVQDTDPRLAIIYFFSGSLVGYQEIAQSRVIGLPALYTDRDRFLYLAWAEPIPGEAANLKVATLRRF